MSDLENPMTIDRLWKHLEHPDPRVYGECAGCQEDIVEGDAYFEINTTNEVLKVHQSAECCYQFVAEMSWCRTAGGE